MSNNSRTANTKTKRIPKIPQECVINMRVKLSKGSTAQPIQQYLNGAKIINDTLMLGQLSLGDTNN
eukprot:scaffold159288_cov18-Prasinocladus_malaysianus.AAC.1